MKIERLTKVLPWIIRFVESLSLGIFHSEVSVFVEFSQPENLDFIFSRQFSSHMMTHFTSAESLGLGKKKVWSLGVTVSLEESFLLPVYGTIELKDWENCKIGHSSCVIMTSLKSLIRSSVLLSKASSVLPKTRFLSKDRPTVRLSWKTIQW